MWRITRITTIITVIITTDLPGLGREDADVRVLPAFSSTQLSTRRSDWCLA